MLVSWWCFLLDLVIHWPYLDSNIYSLPNTVISFCQWACSKRKCFMKYFYIYLFMNVVVVVKLIKLVKRKVCAEFHINRRNIIFRKYSYWHLMKLNCDLGLATICACMLGVISIWTLGIWHYEYLLVELLSSSPLAETGIGLTTACSLIQQESV